MLQNALLRDERVKPIAEASRCGCRNGHFPSLCRVILSVSSPSAKGYDRRHRICPRSCRKLLRFLISAEHSILLSIGTKNGGAGQPAGPLLATCYLLPVACCLLIAPGLALQHVDRASTPQA